MTILQISDTHNRHQLLTNLPTADVLVHCGDFTDMGTEEEALNFLNWLIEQPYRHKIFVTGNHDLCLWEAENIEDLPNNIYFLQDRGCEILWFGIQSSREHHTTWCRRTYYTRTTCDDTGRIQRNTLGKSVFEK